MRLKACLKILYFIAAITALRLFYTKNYSSLNLKIKQEKRQLKVDTRKAPTEDVLIEKIAQENPYLPIEDLLNSRNKGRNFNTSCAQYPLMDNIEIHNDYWQMFKNRNFSFYIFGAYYDNRRFVVSTEPVVRVLAMINYTSTTNDYYPPAYCQLWYDSQRQPFLTRMKDVIKVVPFKESVPGHNYPYLVSCPTPKNLRNSIPRSISLVVNACDKASNNVRVIYNSLKSGEKRKNFAVCTKGMEYLHEDISHRIVEYIETMRILGAEKITMYKLQVHPNITKVLQYYENTGFLEYRPLSFTNIMSNLPEYRSYKIHQDVLLYDMHSLVAYHDCLYRNMYRYQYVAVMDRDEVFMPLGKYSNWNDLMTFARKLPGKGHKAFGSYCFYCARFPYFPDDPPYSRDIPEYFYMLQHVKRFELHVKTRLMKSIHNTDYVIAFSAHMPTHIAENVGSYCFNTSMAQLQHYTYIYTHFKESLTQHFKVDLSLWTYKDEIVNRSMKVFEELQFF